MLIGSKLFIRSLKLEKMDELPYIESVPSSESEWFQALIDLARYLREPEGCPWDREQSALDFAKYAKGEVEEFVEALEGTDSAHIEEEFGDALFTLLASAAAAEEQGLFTLKGSLSRAHEKMVRRHDHVFGENRATTPEEAIEAWEKAKAEERRKNTE